MQATKAQAGMNRRHLFGISTAAALLFTAGSAMAQETPSEWEYFVTPYVWTPGFKVETRAAGPIPSNTIDVGIGEVLSNLEFALEGAFEARKDRFIVLLDFSYFNLSGDKGLGGVVFNEVDMEMSGILSSANVGYRVVDGDAGAVDLFGGVQLFSVDVDLDFKGNVPASASDTATFVDPVIGLRTELELGSGFFIGGTGTIGGFGVDSKLTYQLIGQVGWQANDWLTLRVGYRHFYLEQEGGLIDDVTMSGPIIGATFRL